MQCNPGPPRQIPNCHFHGSAIHVSEVQMALYRIYSRSVLHLDIQITMRLLLFIDKYILEQHGLHGLHRLPKIRRSRDAPRHPFCLSYEYTGEARGRGEGVRYQKTKIKYVKCQRANQKKLLNKLHTSYCGRQKTVERTSYWTSIKIYKEKGKGKKRGKLDKDLTRPFLFLCFLCHLCHPP